MIGKGITDKLSKIGYTSLWLDYGILTIDNLVEQENTVNNSRDQNTEHYRYQTLINYLSSKNQLSDNEFDNYLELIFNDTDRSMAGSATVDLFKKIDLTDFQFEELCRKIGHFGEWTKKVVTRQILMRRLRQNELTDDLFKECMVKGDSVIHEYILDLANVNQFQELAINGKNKKIRNIATEKLNKLACQQR